ncbi:DNA polymerase III subunit delta' [Clostridium bornimense]|uniref:DNA polymerase III subunit delta' n=1 Tax=Clostridium bornimense TaxID=1216932 RepID=UPI001C114C2D|nr:DNA polymerase III subunit delta' [Clostridium bornimense]MBU5316775.1 DNA polymerase III subunit delta' [Clostridium bornimense]
MIIGHNTIRELFLKAIKENTLSHAYLIVGEDGIGKSILVKEIALQILGKTRDIDYVDLINFRSSGKSIGVDDTRKLIIEINKKPFEGDKKVIVIHNCETMTEAAQNAFLKTIEEPPVGVYIFLLCENLASILDTVKSRTSIYRLNRLSKNEIEEYIHKNYGDISEEKEKMLISFSDGIPGAIDKLVKDEEFNNIRDLVLDILLNVKNIERNKIFDYTDKLCKFKDKWEDVLTVFSSYVRDIMVYGETYSIENIINLDKISDIKDLKGRYTYSKLIKILEIIKYVRENLERNVNTEGIFDIMLIRLQEV